MRSPFITIICILISYSATRAQADVNFVNEFLNIGVGARAHGMFGSVSATTDDVTAAYWNPAGLTGGKQALEVSAMHASWFGGISNYDYIGAAKAIGTDGNSRAALTFIRMGIDNIPNTLNLIGPDGSVNYDEVTEFSAADYALMFSYAKKLNQKGLSMGANVKVIRRSLGSFGQAWGFGFDLGAVWKKENFSLSIMGRDISTTVNAWSFDFTEEEKQVFAQTGNVIPVSSTEIALPKLIIGAAVHGGKGSFSYLLEGDIRFSTDGTQSGVLSGESIGIDPTVGLEIGFNKQAFIRAGIGNIQRIVNQVNTSETRLSTQPNVGVGIALGRLKIDYALANLGSTADVLVSHIFSLTVGFE